MKKLILSIIIMILMLSNVAHATNAPISDFDLEHRIELNTSKLAQIRANKDILIEFNKAKQLELIRGAKVTHLTKISVNNLKNGDVIVIRDFKVMAKSTVKPPRCCWWQIFGCKFNCY